MKIVDQQGCVPGVDGEAPQQEAPTDAKSELNQEAGGEQKQGQPQEIPDSAALAGDRRDGDAAEEHRDNHDEPRDPVNVVNEEQAIPDEDDVQALWQSHGRNANSEVPAYVRLIATKRAMNAAGRRVLEQRPQQCLDELEEERARQEVIAFQQATEQRERELQQRLWLAALECRRVQAHSDEPLQPAPRPVCGLPGVLRGRECPNRANHPKRNP
uniref:Uncharacterized protein n=1 Tax=Trichogramma kaykai TaxID=54128 RepID=A0ABD2WFD8_9HYME